TTSSFLNMGSGDQIQVLMLAWQALYYPSPSTSINFPKSGNVKVIKLLDRLHLNSKIASPFDVLY
ncbi:hypothetical protein ACQP3C_29900, partial [Escherichia coli]